MWYGGRGAGAAEEGARYRPDSGRGGGDGVQAAAERVGAGGAEVDEGEQGAGALSRFAFGMGGGFAGSRIRVACISFRRGDYLYGAQAGTCVWTTDQAVGSADGGCADRVAGGSDCLSAEIALGGIGDGAGPDAAGRWSQQGQFWACVGGGRHVWIGGRQGGRTGDVGPGGATSGRGVGNGGGSCAGAGGGFCDCAGADDVAARGERSGCDLRCESCAGAGGCAYGGQDGTGDRAGAWAVAGDGEVCDADCWRRRRCRR